MELCNPAQPTQPSHLTRTCSADPPLAFSLPASSLESGSQSEKSISNPTVYTQRGSGSLPFLLWLSLHSNLHVPRQEATLFTLTCFNFGCCSLLSAASCHYSLVPHTAGSIYTLPPTRSCFGASDISTAWIQTGQT